MLPDNILRQMADAVRAEAAKVAAEKGLHVDYIKSYTDSSYRRGIDDAARQFWKDGSRGGFLTRVNTLVKFGLNDAWIEGAKQVEVSPDEFSAEDKAQIASIIDTEKGYVSGLLDYMDELANSGKPLATAQSRLAMWGNRFADVVSQAMLWFGGKQRLAWVIGPTENHCDSCSRLNGIVAWAQEWEIAGIRPQSHELSCNGWNCLCELQPTTRRRSPRALNSIMNIVQSK